MNLEYEVLSSGPTGFGFPARGTSSTPLPSIEIFQQGICLNLNIFAFCSPIC